MHDEAHDGLEVVSVEGHLTLFGHVDPTGVPRPPATPHALHAFPAVWRLKRVDPTGEAGQDVGGNHLKEGRVGRPYLTPRVTQSDKTLWYTPMKNSYNVGIYTHTTEQIQIICTQEFFLLFLLFRACITVEIKVLLLVKCIQHSIKPFLVCILKNSFNTKKEIFPSFQYRYLS